MHLRLSFFCWCSIDLSQFTLGNEKSLVPSSLALLQFRDKYLERFVCIILELNKILYF